MSAQPVDVLAVMRPATKQRLLERAADYDKGGEFARGKAAGIRSAVEEIEQAAPEAVGVLEVMDDAARTLAKVAQIQMTERAEEMREARAAVAELVDKAETAAQILHNVIAARQIGEGYQSNLDDLNAALARVQGGAA